MKRLATEWSGIISVIIGSLGILLFMSIPHLLGRTYFLDDLRAFHLPIRAFYSQCLADGTGFDWMPSLFGGFFVSGEGQLGAYHPFHWVLYRYFSLRNAFHFELLSSYPAMLLGMYFFLRGFISRRDAAWFGAMVFTFSSFNTLHFVHPNAVAAVAHIPWLLTCMRILEKETGWRRLSAEAGIALLTASQILLGYPQHLWFTLLAEISWGIYLFRGRTSLHARLFLLKTIGLLIGMLQLLPTWDVLQHSERSAPTLDFLLAFSWPPINLFQLVAPYLFIDRAIGGNTHEFGLYLGAVPLVLVGWLLLRSRAENGKAGLVRFLSVFMLVALLLAFGRYGGLAVLQTFLPVVGSFRVPARALVLFQLAWAMLAALAFSEIIKGADETDTRQLDQLSGRMTFYSLLISIVLFLLISISSRPHLLSSWPWIVSGPVLIMAGSYLCRALGRGAAWALPAVILFTALDLGFYGVTYAIFPQVYPGWEHWMSQLPPGKAGDRLVVAPKTFGVPFQYGLNNHFATKGFCQLDGYAGLMPSTRLFGTSASIPALRAAGVRWVSALASPTHKEEMTAVSRYWWEVPRPMPRLRLVSCATLASQPAQAIANIDLETTVLVENPVSLENAPPGSVTMVAESPGSMTVRTVAAGRQLAVLADRFHKGWTAAMDGVGTEIQRVNGDFMGWVVPAGTHTTRLEFHPDSIRQGWRMSELGLFLLALYFCISFRISCRSSDQE